MNDQRLYNVLLGPHTTEKSVSLGEKHGQVAFRVALNATKLEIKQAVESLFNVVVEAVRTSRVNGKVKRFRQSHGKRRSWKKAIVSLKEGHDINLAEFE